MHNNTILAISVSSEAIWGGGCNMHFYHVILRKNHRRSGAVFVTFTVRFG